jgi:hypothetical protein
MEKKRRKTERSKKSGYDSLDGVFMSFLWNTVIIACIAWRR